MRFTNRIIWLAVSCLLSIGVGTLYAQDDAMHAVENALPLLYRPADLPEDARATLLDRMAFYHVSGVSITVIDAGSIAWSNGYGTLSTEDSTPVDTATLFQAASISKPIAALGALELVDADVLELDTPVNDVLTRWHIPANKFTDENPVTLRQLLSHTGGLTVSGFIGYEQGEPLPTLEQILMGADPANTDGVVALTTPGSQYAYSGGGYTVAQLLIEEVSGMPFDAYMQTVLADVGLTRSTYALLDPATAANVASAHYADGSLVAGGWRNHPESAAAGLWTTSDELAQLFIALRASTLGEADAPLSSATAHEMVTPVLENYGLGLAIDGTWISHGGSNVGYKSHAMLDLATGSGVVILTNGDAGSELAQEIQAAVADVYAWSNTPDIVSLPIILPAPDVDQFAGHYQFFTFGADIYAQDGQLYAQLGTEYGGLVLPLYFTSDLAVMSLGGAIQGTFVRGKDGNIASLQTEVPGLGKVSLIRTK